MTREPWKSPDWLEPDWTGRQVEVLRLIARGCTNPEIGEDLGVSFGGAKWHVSEVLSKLGVLSRDDAAAYWRWHTSRRVRAKQFVRGFAALGMGKLAVGGAALALTGAAIAGGVIWLFDSGADATPSPVSAQSAIPTPTPAPPVETASIELNVTVQVDPVSVFAPEADRTITLQRILETGGDKIACVKFGGEFVSRKRLEVTLSNPSLVAVDGAVFPTSSTARSAACLNSTYVFGGVTGMLAHGGWLVFPYSSGVMSSGGLFGGSAGQTASEAYSVIASQYTPRFVQFEWLSPQGDLDPTKRALDFQPASWGSASRYYGVQNRAELGSLQLRGDTWTVSAFRFRGQICLLVVGVGQKHSVGCRPSESAISLGWRPGGHVPYSSPPSASAPSPGMSVGAVRSGADSIGGVPEGAYLLVGEVFHLPDDFGADLAFVVTIYEFETDADAIQTGLPPRSMALASGQVVKEE